MNDRRLRILGEAQAIIDEHGVEGFTIRELSRRADVAQRTLYNIFGSKEDIIADTIHQHFKRLLDALPPAPPADDIEAQLLLIGSVAEQAVKLRRYAAAMVSVFFSPTIDRRIYDSLRWVSTAGGDGWVDRAAKAAVLVDLSPTERDHLIMFMMNGTYSNVVDWVAGRISDKEYVKRGKMNFLISIHPFVRPKHHAKVDELMARLRLTRGTAANIKAKSGTVKSRATLKVSRRKKA